MHIPAGIRAGQCIRRLLHFQHIQCCYTQDLGLTALEKRRTMHAGNDINFSGKGADIAQPAAVNTVILGKDTAADYLALQLFECIADLFFFLGIIHISKFIGQGINY